MRYFFPDSQDQVDPNFDFTTEQSREHRVRQRDDRYAHEMLSARPYDGLLVSKPIVDGWPGASGKYTLAQRHRLYRLGVRSFFRLDQAGWEIDSMGDCGAFAYHREERPPYSVEEVIDYYAGCGFDYGMSVDHVILGYDPTDTDPLLPEWVQRQTLTLELAAEFLRSTKRRRVTFQPLGVAQGWSPTSYANAVIKLQRMGYRYIAVGGMVPLRTHQIDRCLRAIQDVRRPDVSLHLLGISRYDHLRDLPSYGVHSFDSTTPFRQAFKDDQDNYYTLDRNYPAIRVPQVDGNAKIKALIKAGRIDQRLARQLEMQCMARLSALDRGTGSVRATVKALRDYAVVLEIPRDRSDDYQRLLGRAPWRECECGVCAEAGVHVAIFRGTERNKRRGFHNLHVFSRRVANDLNGTGSTSSKTCVDV